jgi:hypothetical protein
LPNVDTARLEALGKDIVDKVIPILEDGNALIPEIRDLDQMLMVSVDPSLAVAHALAGGYMIEMIQGAAECFVGLDTDLKASAKSWDDADGATASEFG